MNFKYSPSKFLKAMKSYEALRPAIDVMWMEAESIEQIEAAERLTNSAIDACRVAYHEMTKDRNSLESCMRIDIDFLRKMAVLAVEDETERNGERI